MLTARTIRLLLAIALLVTTAACANDVRLRYEVEATFVIHGETMTAKSVWELTAHPIQNVPLSQGDRIDFAVRGEALSLGSVAGTSYYMLRRDVAYGPFPVQCLHDEATIEEGLRAIESFEGPCRVKRARAALVAFTDKDDPKTIAPQRYGLADGKSVCPADEEICLLRLVVTRTEAPVSTGLEQELPWLRLGTMGSKIGTGEYVPKGTMTWTPRDFYNIDFSTEVNWDYSQPK